MSSDPVRILQITDPHLFAAADASLRGRVTSATLQSVLDHIEKSAWPADFVALTGDVVQDGSREAYERCRRMLTRLGLPVHCVPGNHDVRPLMQELLHDEPFYYCETVESNNWLIVGLDSCAEGTPAGRIDEAEIERLEGLVASTDADNVMVCLHHPPLPVGSKWLDEVGLQNGAQFLQRIVAAGKVRLCLFGHVHQVFEDVYESIRIIGTPSTCRQFAIASDTFNVDDNPPAYRRIALFANGSIDTELIWV